MTEPSELRKKGRRQLQDPDESVDPLHFDGTPPAAPSQPARRVRRVLVRQ